MDRKPVLLHQASNKQELTNWENILITKIKDCIINFERILCLSNFSIASSTSIRLGSGMSGSAVYTLLPLWLVLD